MERIRIAVIDDHPLYREGVIHTLMAQDDMAIVEQGASADDAIRIARERRPDVIVLDLHLPGGGNSAIETIAAEHPTVNVLMLTVAADEERVTAALRRGARGYLLKGVSGPELAGAVRAVSRGELHVSPALVARLLGRTDAEPAGAGPEPRRLAHLTCRERQIVTLVSQGLSNKEIGGRLELSEKTVKHYVTSVMRKLQVRNRVEAALLIANRTPEFSLTA
jgi:two-component system, NarL family, nitrate/nitrite response regulator NarL